MGLISVAIWLYVYNFRKPRGCRDDEAMSSQTTTMPSKRTSWQNQARASRYWNADDIGKSPYVQISTTMRRLDADQHSEIVVLPMPDSSAQLGDRESKVVILPAPDPVHTIEYQSFCMDKKVIPHSDSARPTSRRVRTLSTHISMQFASMTPSHPVIQKPRPARSSYERGVVVDLDWQEYK